MPVPFKKLVVFPIILALAACGGRKEPPEVAVGVKLGKPYEVNGKTYVPEKDDSYDKIGDGSWYGPGFHGKRTASGEKFNENDITAAHPTLPMPSLVRVTNLSNEKSVIVRVNDRGPFHSNRIIDLSKKSAEMIDLKSTKPVRVQYLREETEAYMADVKAGKPPIDMAAYNISMNMGDGASYFASKQDSKPETEIADYNNSDNDDNIDGTLASSDAPVQSIISADLAAPSKNQTSASKHFIIKEAAADELPNHSKTKGKEVELKPLPTSGKLQVASKQLPEKMASGKSAEKSSTKQTEKSGEKYIVLAGSFSSETNAKTLVSKLPAKSKSTIDKINVSGKNWWRVHVGPFTSKDKAEDALEAVQKAGVKDARIGRL